MRIQVSGLSRSCGRVRRYQWSNSRKWLTFREASVVRGQRVEPVFNIVDVPGDQSFVQRADLQALPLGIGKSNPGENLARKPTGCSSGRAASTDVRRMRLQCDRAELYRSRGPLFPGVDRA